MKGGHQLEKENWPSLMKGAVKKIDLTFRSILQSMTKKQIDKSKVQTEADKTRAEMMEWATQVSRGRIQNEPVFEEEFEVVEEINEPIF